MVDIHHLFDPRMLTQLRNSGFFRHRLSVIDRVESGRDAIGAPTYTTEVRAGHDQLPAALSYVNTGERMTQVGDIVTADRRMLLAGYYPNIAHDDKIRDDTDLGIAEADRPLYRITKIDHDSLGQLTRVYLEDVTP